LPLGAERGLVGSKETAPSDAGGACWKMMRVPSQRARSPVGPPRRVIGYWRRMCIACVMGACISCDPRRAKAQDRLLQRRLVLGPALGKLHLGDGDEDLGAGLEIRRLEHGLLLRRPVGPHPPGRLCPPPPWPPHP